MQRYFINAPYEKKESYVISGDNYHHMVHVMRMRPGQQVFLVFNDQLAILAEIFRITDNEVLLVEKDKVQENKELPIQVTIASGYPKGDKLEWIVQKGTELGCHHFIGFPAKASIVKWDDKKRQKKEQRLAKIAVEAAEQAHRQVIPTVELFGREQELIDSFSVFDKVVIAYEESAKKDETSLFSKVLSELSKGQKVLLIFGPEGGFLSDEIHLFQNHHALLCGLGPRIMRTETAPLYALSAISYQFELL